MPKTRAEQFQLSQAKGRLLNRSTLEKFEQPALLLQFYMLKSLETKGRF